MKDPWKTSFFAEEIPSLKSSKVNEMKKAWKYYKKCNDSINLGKERVKWVK